MSIHPEQHPLDGKLEPETKDCFNDRAPLYSIAISLKRIADAPREAAARITELEDENEQLRLAICGGEDAPGYAASLPLATILQVQTNNELEWRARAERAEARCWALENASTAEPSGWRPIEGAPKDGTTIMGWRAGWGPCECRWEVDFDGDECSFAGWVDPNADDDTRPTHWMPLPLPPTSEGGGA